MPKGRLVRDIGLLVLGAVVVAGMLAGLAPAIRAYTLSLADGMSVKS